MCRQQQNSPKNICNNKATQGFLWFTILIGRTPGVAHSLETRIRENDAGTLALKMIDVSPDDAWNAPEIVNHLQRGCWHACLVCVVRFVL